MKSIIFLISIFVLSACSTQVVDSDQKKMNMDNHIGCQESEIDENGNCEVSQENNRMLFEKNFDDEIVAQEVKTDSFQGYMSASSVSESENLPLVVMIHEWWGLNDNIKYMADLLASEGYRVMAIDLYDGQVAAESDQARILATSVRENPSEAVDKMKSALEWVNQEYGYTKVASLGWCFGGQQSLNLSLAEDLDATVIYYGNLLTTESELESISGPVLGIFGSEDSGIPVAQVREFESALNDLGIANDINIYEGVGHAFANPSGDNYAPEETIDAWEKTLEFLNENLR